VLHGVGVGTGKIWLPKTGEKRTHDKRGKKNPKTRENLGRKRGQTKRAVERDKQNTSFPT